MKEELTRYDRDTGYWNEYYKKTAQNELRPSRFAEDITGYLKEDGTLLEFGCGNGRDSLFFRHLGLSVTGIDASDYTIHHLQKTHAQEGLIFKCDDFTSPQLVLTQEYDYVYARFVLHAIDEIQERTFLKNANKALIEKGLLFIEVRTVNDDIYGLGEQVGRHAFIYNNHYRRFVEKEELAARIDAAGGFVIRYMEEKRGFAPAGGEDPVILRVILEKKQCGIESV